MTDTQLCLKYSDNTKKKQKEIVFESGLHVIYGESGSGKSNLIKEIAAHSNNQFESNSRFVFKIQSVPSPLQVILQNPDDQIVGDTVRNEILFSIECQLTDTGTLLDKYSNAVKKITFIENLKRHPVSLSGGEKELLNIVTSTMLPMKCILIDDALSFLSISVKNIVVDYLMSFADDYDCSVLWFSSDYRDLKYGITQLEIKTSFFDQVDYKHLINEKKIHTTAGSVDLSIINLSFQYDDGPKIFSKLNVDINNFRALGIKGSNGCGKTTLVHLIQSIENKYSGSIKVFNSKTPDYELRIGYLDQFPERMLGATTLVAFLDELIKRDLIIDEEVAECYNKFHEHKIDWNSIKNILPIDLPWSILRQSLIIILTLCNYDLLILDEPTFGFGWKQKLNLSLHLRHFIEKKCLIIVSHDDEFLESICDQIITLDEKNINIAKDLNGGKKH